jgi:glycosyltransferase involved in cell wall biosynthesis
MKRLFIDCSHTSMYPFKKTGIHRVVRNISRELVKIGDQTDIEVKLVRFDGAFVQEINLSSLSTFEAPSKVNVLNKKVSRKLGKAFYLVVEKLGFSRFFSWLYKKDSKWCTSIQFTDGDIYLILDANWDLTDSYYEFLSSLRPLGGEVVLLCYDLIPIKFPAFCSRAFSNAVKHFYSKYSEIFDAVICISDKVKDDYLEFLEELSLSESSRPKLVASFKLGSDFPAEITEQFDRKATSFQVQDDGKQFIQESLSFGDWRGKSYFLAVGSLVPHKNVKTIVSAFGQFCYEQDDYFLILVGNRGWHQETDNFIESSPWFEKRIFILEDLSDEQLGELYNNCYCLIQASFYEGYGLPVVEALQRGRPVISSTGGSLPEVGGDLCLYFDPYDSLELYKKLQQITASSDYYESLLHRIRTEYKPISWEASAQQLLDRLHELSSLPSHF